MRTTTMWMWVMRRMICYIADGEGIPDDDTMEVQPQE